MMTTFPPAPEDQVTLANWRTAPFCHWAFHHVREIVPSAEIANDPHRVQALDAGAGIPTPMVQHDGVSLDLDGYLSVTDTDGLVVLHHGRVVFERYCNGMQPHDPHICMSVSKSMTALLAGILAGRGLLDLDADCVSYIPELGPTAFAGATVRDLLDMRTGISFPEDYQASGGVYIDYRKATNWNPAGSGDAPTDLRSFFLTLTDSIGPHGGPFDYKSPCTDLLGWIIERAAGRRFADLFGELIWQPMGAERSAYVTVDRLGAPRVAGGICTTTRDLARLGDLVTRDGGSIVPAAWIEDIETAGDPDAWAKGSYAADFPDEPLHYRSKWYVWRDRGPILMCLGIHGQNLFVDRKAGLVLARHSSSGVPLELAGDLLTLQLFERIRDAL